MPTTPLHSPPLPLTFPKYTVICNSNFLTIYSLSVQCPCCFSVYFLGSKHLIFNFSYIYSSLLVMHLIFSLYLLILRIHWNIRYQTQQQVVPTYSNLLQQKTKRKKRPESLFSGVIRSKTPIISDNRYYPAD